MKRTLLYALFAGTLILNSCKKNELPKMEEQGSPVFYLRCTVNGLPVNIQAGDNGYYMSSSHYRDKNDVNVYKGELRQKDCGGKDCGFSMAVLINDYKFSAPAGNEPMDVDNGLKVGAYQFNTGGTAPLYYSADFAPASVMPGGQYQWQFSDNENSTDTAPSKKLFANKVYSVTLSADDPRGGCIISHTNVFKMGNPLQTNIHSTFQAGTYHFSADADLSGTAPYKYLWDFGDGTPPSTASNPKHAYASQDYYEATLTLIDANNDTCVSFYQVNTVSNCEANFTGKFKPVRNTKALSTITILITDPSGKVYSSSELGQDANSKFEITAVEEFRANENNEPTKKLKIRFNCTLNSSTGPLTINNGEAVIAVSYK